MHWRNSNFQYVHFIFGACHTAVEAHRKCCEAIEDREVALCHANKSATVLTDDAAGRQIQANLDQGKRELDFLLDCKAELEANIGRVPNHDDYQQNQRDEWRLELEFRAENFLLCGGYIPPDQFATMRAHPDFPKIASKIAETKQLIADGGVLALPKREWTLALEDK